MSRRTLRLLVASYLVKTLLFAVAWLLDPELPRRAIDGARVAWLTVAGGARP